MKKISKSIVVFALAGMCFVSCKDEKKEKEIITYNVETTENPSEEKVAPMSIKTVFNANLATEADLSALGLNAETVSQIVEKRPFLSMLELDALLQVENKEEVYKTLFVPFNLNTTAEADFMMIPGVGKKMAHEFEEYRPYTSVKQFKREIGKYVDEDEVKRYLNYVFVPVELNTATEEDIKALPGVGDKMAHEFEEYRPYKNMAQFRKEIGKYVDDNELKRLERLVYLKDN
ncbi:helix-hairpin-helix domain-containing protein [Winogradskyella litorisediminis]|uniref:Helix-hairpin-helix domain-containing protein n=1 Tax=Winogradskyella litorisediminis TaxID=1156618 RepID=A0ABW3NC83_9FLAO